MSRASRAIEALRKPDASLQTVPNTVRQSIAEVIEDTTHQLDRYGVALMMIREGCADPADLARKILAEFQDRSGK